MSTKSLDSQSFDQTLLHLRSGLVARRAEWFEGAFVFHRWADNTERLRHSHPLYGITPYTPPIEDILALDWVLNPLQYQFVIKTTAKTMDGEASANTQDQYYQDVAGRSLAAGAATVEAPACASVPEQDYLSTPSLFIDKNNFSMVKAVLDISSGDYLVMDEHADITRVRSGLFTRLFRPLRDREKGLMNGLYDMAFKLGLRK